MTPPLANGVRPAVADGEAPPMLPNRLPSPPARSLASGLNAFVTAKLDSRNASDFNTSSNCLPPTTASLKALLIALVADTERLRARIGFVDGAGNVGQVHRAGRINEG